MSLLPAPSSAQDLFEKRRRRRRLEPIEYTKEIMKKIWPFSFYFLYFSAFASLIPFFVLFYQNLGFNGAQIGLLTGVPPLIILVGGPFLTGVADSRQRHRLI